MGCIPHDENESILMETYKVENKVQEVDTMEALAILRGVQLIFNMVIQRLIIESDSYTIGIC